MVAPAPTHLTAPSAYTLPRLCLHVLHDLAQHVGQMELSRDILLDEQDRRRDKSGGQS